MNALSWLSLRTLSGRLIWLLVVLLFATQLLLTVWLVLRFNSNNSYDEAITDTQARQIVTTMHAVENVPPNERNQLLELATSDEAMYAIVQGPDQQALLSQYPIDDSTSVPLLLNDLKHYAGREAFYFEPNEIDGAEQGEPRMPLAFGEHWLEHSVFVLPLVNGDWLFVSLPRSFVIPANADQGAVISSLINTILFDSPYYIATSLLMIPAIMLVARKLTQPLTRLAQAAELLGRGDNLVQVKEEGSEEIRIASAAFNQMSQRIHRFSTDRNQMMIAISHDLRSPLTGMRLQAEFIEDDSARESIINAIEEMQAMTQALLKFARDEYQQEAYTETDTQTLLTTLTAQYQAAQQLVEFKPTSTTGRVRIQVQGVLRALRNVIDNALNYGGSASISLMRNDDHIEVHIEDDGPGIAPERQEEMFEPFTRLDDSRSQQGGGIGMGLSIARSLIRRVGGDITLSNYEHETKSGLRVTISLPLIKPA